MASDGAECCDQHEYREGEPEHLGVRRFSMRGTCRHREPVSSPSISGVIEAIASPILAPSSVVVPAVQDELGVCDLSGAVPVVMRSGRCPIGEYGLMTLTTPSICFVASNRSDIDSLHLGIGYPLFGPEDDGPLVAAGVREQAAVRISMPSLLSDAGAVMLSVKAGPTVTTALTRRATVSSQPAMNRHGWEAANRPRRASMRNSPK